jgi:hypothetical protein
VEITAPLLSSLLKRVLGDRRATIVFDRRSLASTVEDIHDTIALPVMGGARLPFAPVLVHWSVESRGGPSKSVSRYEGD